MKFLENTKIIFIILAVASFSDVFAQGFDWQYSPRLPFKTPNFYYGAKLEFGLAATSGDITFLENNIACPNFSEGSGNDFSFSLAAERWFEENNFSLVASAGYTFNNLRYSFTDFVPINNKITAEYENLLTFSYNTISATFGVKHRISSSHLHIGAGIAVNVNFAANYEVIERIVGPPEVPPFSTNPPSYKREILAGEFYQISPITLVPKFDLGYDLQLGLSKYITPIVSISLPVMGITKTDNVHKFVFSFGLRYLMTHF